ncbi:MAG TPA: hypothetical protein VFC19_34445 [Candidatus Limnocylindrales bacterium]|nr:hypothetical protein [Candidatus Limnocylindrales bacterium]
MAGPVGGHVQQGAGHAPWPDGTDRRDRQLRMLGQQLPQLRRVALLHGLGRGDRERVAGVDESVHVGVLHRMVVRGGGTREIWALRANVEHNHVRHEHLVIPAIQTEPVPRVAEDERLPSTTWVTPTTASFTSPPATAAWRRRTSPLSCAG